MALCDAPDPPHHMTRIRSSLKMNERMIVSEVEHQAQTNRRNFSIMSEVILIVCGDVNDALKSAYRERSFK